MIYININAQPFSVFVSFSNALGYMPHLFQILCLGITSAKLAQDIFVFQSRSLLALNSDLWLVWYLWAFRMRGMDIHGPNQS